MKESFAEKKLLNRLKNAGVLVFFLAFAAIVQSQMPAQEPVSIVNATVVSRDVWQDVPAAQNLMSTQDRIKGIVIHHTAGRAPVEADEAMILKNIQSFHMTDMKWGDIAYHYLIAPSGKIYEGRNPKFAGDSGTKYDTNSLLMICFVGTYDKRLPTPMARHSLKKLINNRLAYYRLVESNVCCHRDLAQTDCPGNALYGWVQLQKWGAEQ
ncbi:MAG: peptidoglycan recognition protein family protein [Candidatus Riflebacteria bacterium]|nr:peptidoglycan recognition protein family protein [Candidatus Riflebacteria bacterium]